MSKLSKYANEAGFQIGRSLIRQTYEEAIKNGGTFSYDTLTESAIRMGLAEHLTVEEITHMALKVGESLGYAMGKLEAGGSQ